MSSVALTLGFYVPALGKGDGRVVGPDEAETLGIELTNWISIDKAGKVTVLDHRSEMGQGSFQTVPQIVAEELEVDMDHINILFAPGSQSKYGSQITGGSSTVRGGYKALLRTGATAREMLIDAAAKKWNVSKDECYAENGKVIHKPTGKQLNYGELVEDAAKLKPPTEVRLKERKNYKLIGKPMQRQDTPRKVNGKAEFGIDKKMPGLLYASVERSPRFLGKVKNFDAAAAKAVPGVKNVFVVKMPVFDTTREGVVVVADSIWTAQRARKLLKIEWDDEGFEHLSTEQLYARMNEDLKKPSLSQRTGGNFDAAFAKAEKKVEAIYQTPYESHSAMEPLNCTAFFQESGCEIWGPIQAPDWIQMDVSQRLGIPVEKVKVNMTFLGGGFG
ncbi:MAG: molybdopterin cofactor-binding domain-containing protein, partial [Chitinophagales bacterium]